MANEVEHIECANRTQKTISYLIQEKEIHSPWIAITAFYKALHVVEAVFDNERPEFHAWDHETREAHLKLNRKYEHIYKHYSPLKRASLNARYLSGCGNFDDYLSPDRVINRLLKHHLNQIERSSIKFLKSSSHLQLIASDLP